MVWVLPAEDVPYAIIAQLFCLLRNIFSTCSNTIGGQMSILGEE
jgi:hypothetical protein